MQTTLDLGAPSQKKPRAYAVRRYRLDWVRESDPKRVVIHRREDVEGFVKQYLDDTPIERVIVVALDSGNRMVGYQVEDGVVNQCATYPQKVFSFLLSVGAAAFIIAHNHPADSLQPSLADWKLTDRLHRIGKDLDITMLDHIIITSTQAVSLRGLPRWPK